MVGLSFEMRTPKALRGRGDWGERYPWGVFPFPADWMV